LSATVRFSLHYAAFFLTMGAFLPFYGEWLKGRGLSPEWIGLIWAAGTIGRAVCSPFFALWADARPRRRDAILVFAALSLLLFLLHAPARAPVMLLILSFMVSAAFYGQIPMSDSFAMRASARSGMDFGRIRAIGSAFFILANILAGLAYAGFDFGWASFGGFGGEAILIWVLAGASLTLITARLLPAGRRRRPTGGQAAGWRDLIPLLRSPFLLVLLASAGAQSAHGFYYALSAVAWADRGMSGALIGGLWGLGVLAEIGFFFISGRWIFARMGPATLLILGCSASILRWGLTALAPPLWALAPLQLLHAFSFAASYLGFLRYAAAHVPDRQAATAQSINSALSGGLFTALTSAASGYLYQRIGEAGFAAMIIPSAFGLIAAMLLLRVRRLPQHGKMD
jgi:PPP family 3-phenylpropionic acid transporter